MSLNREQRRKQAKLSKQSQNIRIQRLELAVQQQQRKMLDLTEIMQNFAELLSPTSDSDLGRIADELNESLEKGES